MFSSLWFSLLTLEENPTEKKLNSNCQAPVSNKNKVTQNRKSQSNAKVPSQQLIQTPNQSSEAKSQTQSLSFPPSQVLVNKFRVGNVVLLKEEGWVETVVLIVSVNYKNDEYTYSAESFSKSSVCILISYFLLQFLRRLEYFNFSGWRFLWTCAFLFWSETWPINPLRCMQERQIRFHTRNAVDCGGRKQH